MRFLEGGGERISLGYMPRIPVPSSRRWPNKRDANLAPGPTRALNTCWMGRAPVGIWALKNVLPLQITSEEGFLILNCSRMRRPVVKPPQLLAPSWNWTSLASSTPDLEGPPAGPRHRPRSLYAKPLAGRFRRLNPWR